METIYKKSPHCTVWGKISYEEFSYEAGLWEHKRNWNRILVADTSVMLWRQPVCFSSDPGRRPPLICLLQTIILITEGFFLKNFFPITLIQGKWVGSLILVGECLKERWQCQRLRAHIDSVTLWITNTAQVFTEFFSDSNAESLQIHFWRRVSAFCQT